MGVVLKFPGHKRERCRGDCYGACARCALYICETCGGAEASLPKHCPGARMTVQQQDAVQAGAADYRDGGWVYYGYRATEVFDR